MTRAFDDPMKMSQLHVLDHLLASHPAQLSSQELRQAIGSDIDTDDAVRELRSYGLIHQHGDFFWLTRSAVHLCSLHDWL
jgi:superfamily II helicase